MVKITGLLTFAALIAVSNAYTKVGQKDGCAGTKEPRAQCLTLADCCASEICNSDFVCEPKPYYGCPAGQNAGNICDYHEECCDNEVCVIYPEESETGICELKKEFTQCPTGQHSFDICDGNDECCPGEQCNFYMEVSETGICEPKNYTQPRK